MSYDTVKTVIWMSTVVDLLLVAALASCVLKERWLLVKALTLLLPAIWLAKTVLISLLVRYTGFTPIRIVYLDLVIVLPVAGILLAVIAARQLRGTAKGVALGLSLLLFALAPIGIYTSFIGPFDLRTERATVKVPSQRSGEEPVTVAVIADLQTDQVTEYEREAIDRVMDLTPDLILLPGDVFHGVDRKFEPQIPKLRKLLAKLEAPGGVFLVQGDVDKLDRFEKILKSTEIELLYNQEVTVKVKDRKITVGGLQLAYWQPSAQRFIKRFEQQPGSEDIRILLTHRPDPVLTLATDSRVDLTVAGHTHGGQIALPLLGPLMTATDVPRKVAAGGLHSIDDNGIYVSRGVGVERTMAPRIRFGVPPEISLLTLTK